MLKASSIFTVVAVAMVILVSISFNMATVEAANGANYSIEQVNHTIEVMYNGYILINDTIRIVGNASEGTEFLNHFLVGVPYEYGSHIIRCIAYDTSSVFNVTLDVPLENRVGFYAVEIGFPQPLNISCGTTHAFTVGFILSNDLLSNLAKNNFTFGFPAYPSLTKTVTRCNVTVVLPEGAGNITIAKDDGAVKASTYSKENLLAFTCSSANIIFSLSDSQIQLVDVKELKREVRINEVGEIEGSDSYYIESKSTSSISSIEIILPPGASGSSVKDQFGRKMSQPTKTDAETNRYKVTFSSPLESYRSTRFTVYYHLLNVSTTQIGINNFNVTFPLFKHVNYYIEWTSVSFVLPEGARISSFETTLIGSAYSITRSIFQEIVTINRRDISCLENVLPSENVLRMVYEYNPLWLSFRPTLWMWALAVVGCAVVFVWKRPKVSARVAVPTVAVRLHLGDIKAFVDGYEEKRKITLDIESLESRVRKGKIPRRRYKVQRKTLETRLSALSRNLAEIKERMRVAGGLYVESMRQLEIAETEINEVEANIKSIEARHSRGELSLEAYRKLLTDYQHRKERADTAISGILLRLREEIR